ncbi:amidohydrolase family protein [Thermococcus stetteri]|uniref:amidohydrolase family protein n=1 Tax=Thermococcus stetteri TaxID=49900 RepID=UPI001AE8E4BF|nr:amidohydrolase [Thermococcus stetteri]MBP1912533.1 5-methylthioadenosine/S-adenosylhomocysteine deaminase [Thermococcus stetteri]
MIALIGDVIDAERILRNHAVLVEGNTISAVVPAEKVREFGPDEVYGEDGFFVIPGLINAHTHVAMARFRGLGEDMPTEEWLEKIIWPMEREWTASEIREWARIGIIEALMNGSTTINDHYFFADEIAKEAERVGIRAFIGQTVIDLVDFPHAEPEEGFKFFRRWRGKSELITPTLAPHATNTVSLRLMMEITELSEEENARIHIHLAQSRAEVKEVKSRYGLKPVEYLKRAGALNDRLLGVHGVYLTDEEIRMLASAGSTLVHCPTSNVKLEGRTINLSGVLQTGVKVALGNDSPNPVGIMDMFLEMRTSALFANLLEGKAHSIPARKIFEIATVGGARALGIRAGLVREGYLADLLLIDARKPWFGPKADPYSLLVYSARGSDVAMTMVNGKIVWKKEGR